MNGDDRERAILAGTERLLGERPLHELSVDDLARAAGISRSSFYFYFASKEAVLLALLQRVAAEASTRRLEALAGVTEASPDAYRAAISAFHETFRAHRAVSLAAADARASSPEIRAQWSVVMAGWVAETAAVIEAERARGAAPPGVPAHDLAVALNLMNERVLYAAFADESPAPEGDVVEALVAVWHGAIHGAPAA
jgi:AcrR family transcriptional regulator